MKLQRDSEDKQTAVQSHRQFEDATLPREMFEEVGQLVMREVV